MGRMGEEGNELDPGRIPAPEPSLAQGNGPVHDGRGWIISTKDRKKVSEIVGNYTLRKKDLGVYLTTSQPHNKVIIWLTKEGISVESLFFLDMTGSGKDATENLFSLRDPSDFTELSVVITEIMENEGINFMVIDGISGLETYSGADNVRKFLHALVSYFKKLNKTLILAYGTGEDKALSDFAVQISDVRL